MNSKRIEYAFGGLTLTAILFKLFLWPAASIITVLSFFFYGFFSLVYCFSLLKKLDGLFDKLLISLLGIGFLIALLGLMNIFMSWKNEYLLMGTGGILIWISVTYFKFRRPNSKLLKFTLDKGVIIGACAMFIFILPKYTIYKIKHRHEPRLIELYIEMQETQSKAAKKAFEDLYYRKKLESQ